MPPEQKKAKEYTTLIHFLTLKHNDEMEGRRIAGCQVKIRKTKRIVCRIARKINQTLICLQKTE